MGAERRLRGAERRLRRCQVWGHLESVLAVFKLWLGFSGVSVRRVTVGGFLDKNAAVWFLRGCAVLLLVGGIFLVFCSPYPMGAHPVNATPRHSGQK